MTPHECVDAGIQGTLPRRKVQKNRPPPIKTFDLEEKLDRWWYPKPEKLLTPYEKRVIMGCVVEQNIKQIFGSHFYMWDNKIYQQMQGCPMGLEGSGPIAHIVMDFWVDEMMKIESKMKSLSTLNPIMFERLEIFLLSKYVDDIVTALEEFKRGVRWSNEHKALMWSTENELQDREKDPEILTMDLFSSIASSIMKCLQFTWDSPNNNATGTMPVLDTKMWVGLEAREWGLPEGMPGLDKLKLTMKINSLKRIIL